MKKLLVVLGLAFVLVPRTASAATVHLTVTFDNLTRPNSISYAPVRIGIGNGTFDSFDINAPATAPIISIAEGGSGSAWFPEFAAAEPNAVTGTVGGGAILPGGSASATFLVDTSQNQYFTFASMVVPSNDLFIGNDDPQRYRLFDDAGNLLISEILQEGSSIWDAGSEAADPANAAFLVGGVNANRTPENGVVNFDFSELSAYDGLQTAAGYTFDSGLITANTDIGRFRFSAFVVPEPSTSTLACVGGVAFAFLRRRRD